MELMNQIFPNVQIALERISKTEHFTDPVIVYHDKLCKGQGFMGDIFFINIEDKKSSKKLELVVKQSSLSEYVRKTFPLHVLYHNESKFYEKIWMKFIDFQKKYLKTLIFDNLPKCYATGLQPGNEFIILENLNTLHFMNIEKNQFFNEEQVELIFQKYGQFHGISFAYKSKLPDEFVELSGLLIPYWSTLSSIDLFKDVMKKGITDCLSYLDPLADANIIKILDNYVKNTMAIFQKSFSYKGTNGVILQGDCWSNNIFLKYNSFGKLEDMKLIDFQISNVGSVVNDLSYCLYAGGSKEIFDNLHHYLNIYHKSLTDTCLRFGCTNFISFEELKEEWKDYGKFGFILGLSLVTDKLSESISQDDMKNMFKDHTRQADTQKIKRKLLELASHMYDNDFL